MKVSAHIGIKLLTDVHFCDRVFDTHVRRMQKIIPSGEFLDNDTERLKRLVYPRGSINYIVADTVMKNIEMIKLKKPYEYKAIAKLPEGKRTFLLPNNEVVRLVKTGNDIQIGYFTLTEKGTPHEYIGWDFWGADLATGITTMQKNEMHRDIIDEEFFLKYFEHSIDQHEHIAFAILCFIFLSEITEEVIAPGSRIGTKKQGKIINDSPFKFIRVHSKWNITTIRTEEIHVAPHLALRWTGVGRVNPRIVLIEQYTKSGYIRKAEK